MKHKYSYQSGFSTGSALLLAVVLTSMLAIIGTIFLMTARIDNMSTSGVAEGKELDFAVQTIIEKISHELVLDTPGVGENQEYYDYPDTRNAWLANIEPYLDGGKYKWRQISDVTGFLNRNGIDTNDIDSDPYGLRKTIEEYLEIELDGDGHLDYSGTRNDHASADADGDGIADAKWFELDNVTTNKGKTIYAAVRVIDNGGMLNINTAYQFDANETGDRRRVDGTRQHQIDLEWLVPGLTDANREDRIETFSEARHGTRNPTESDLENYYADVIARMEAPHNLNVRFGPFDILDEFELRYRFCVPGPAKTRLKAVWPGTLYDRINNDPYDGRSEWGYDDWTDRITNPHDPNYPDYRHFLTAYNMDRIINPSCHRMVNINTDDGNDIYMAIRAALVSNGGRAGILASGDVNALAAQMAANIIDYRDEEEYEQVTKIDVGATSYYGFERPVICISELAYRFYEQPPAVPGDPCIIYRSYAVELYKRFGNERFDPGEWQLVIENDSGRDARDISSEDFNSVGGQFYVIVWQQAAGPQDANLADTVEWNDSPENGATGVNPDVILRWPMINDDWTYNVYFGTDEADIRDANSGGYQTNQPEYSPSGGASGVTYYWRVDDVDSGGRVRHKGDVWSFTTGNPKPNLVHTDPNTLIFDANTTVSLERRIYGTPVIVDSRSVNFDDAVAKKDGSAYSIMRRDTSSGNWIKRIWDINEASANLGSRNNYFSPGNPLPAWPRNERFTNIGELGQVFRVNAYERDWADTDREADVKIDLADPNLQALFKYLTVADPNRDGVDNDGDGSIDNVGGDDDRDTPERKIAGRININTAPAYVISKLPWVSIELAEAIVAYRDKMPNPVNYSNRLSAIESILDNSTDGTSEDVSLGDIREEPGFENIGELNFVIKDTNDASIRYYSLDGNDLTGFPDLTFGSMNRVDGVANDFDERDVIFTRISDLVTVRSDVFTAYILVRIGIDGPQKRYIALLDRSNVYSARDKVKVVALQPVPDPR